MKEEEEEEALFLFFFLLSLSLFSRPCWAFVRQRLSSAFPQKKPDSPQKKTYPKKNTKFCTVFLVLFLEPTAFELRDEIEPSWCRLAEEGENSIFLPP